MESSISLPLPAIASQTMPCLFFNPHDTDLMTCFAPAYTSIKEFWRKKLTESVL